MKSLLLPRVARTTLNLITNSMVAVLLLAGAAAANAQTLEAGLDTTNLVWTTGGDSPWFYQTTNTHDGIDAVRSGVVASNMSSYLETTIVGPGTLKFWIKTAGVAPNVQINPLEVAPYHYGWSFYMDWEEWVFDLRAGTNAVRLSAWSGRAPFAGASGGFVAIDQLRMELPRPLSIVIHPTDNTVYAGNPGWFGVSAIGTPPLRYQWQRDGTNLVDATNDWLMLTNVTEKDAGAISVTVSNEQGVVVSSNALLTVLPASAPVFLFQLENQTAYYGQAVSLWVAVEGTEPFSYQWRKDGTNIPGATSSSLDFPNVAPADGGAYTVVVSNTIGVVESSNAVLTVLPSVAPMITRQPRSLEVAEGVSTWMHVEASGLPEPDYRWRKAGEVDPPSSGPWIPFPSPSSVSPFRSFDTVTTNDAGVYWATVSNSAGTNTSREAQLTVLPPLAVRGTWGTGAVTSVFVTDGLAYLARGSDGLSLLNVSNSACPEVIATFDTPGYASAVRVYGGLAFVADGWSGLQIICVTNAANPVLAGTYTPTGYVSDLVVRSNLVFLAARDAGIIIVDVSNPSAPIRLGSYSTNLSPDHIAVSGDRAYLTSLRPVLPNWRVGGMLMLDVSDPTHPVEVGRFGSEAGAIDVREQFAFINVGGGFRVVNASNPAMPEIVGTLSYYWPDPSQITRISTDQVRVVGDYAFVSASLQYGWALFVLDVRDAGDPVAVGYIRLPERAEAIWVDGRHIYLAGYALPLQIIESPFKLEQAGAPVLSVTSATKPNIRLTGRRGFHYALEAAEQLGGPWRTVGAVLATNETSTVEAPAGGGTRFFRAREEE